MTLVLRYAFLMIVFALTGEVASAQVATGTPPFGSFGGGPDAINLANLNSHITIPVIHKPGRGTNFTYDLSFDTSVWYPVTSGSTTSWQPVGNWGWRGQTEVFVGYITYTHTIVPDSCYDSGGKIIHSYDHDYSNFAYHDPFGITHHYTITQYTGYCLG
jgi:hypothetical protein